MELPKFKIGQKVQMRHPDRVLVIDGIVKKGTEYFYVFNPDEPRYAREEHLFHYEEPKKLFAFLFLSGEVKFFERDLALTIRLSPNDEAPLRAPQYDIDYPQSK